MSNYDGRTYLYPDGSYGGIPYDLLQNFSAAAYIAAGKAIPRHYNMVNEPDGSTWEYQFLYDNPYQYVFKYMKTAPTVTAGGELIDSGGIVTDPEPNPDYVFIPGQGYIIPGVGDYDDQTQYPIIDDVGTIVFTPQPVDGEVTPVTPVIDTPSTGTKITPSATADIIGVGFLSLVAASLGRKRRKRK
jgi:hypothetical protein